MNNVLYIRGNAFYCELVYENGTIIRENEDIEKYIDKSCLKYGCDKRGRVKYSKYILDECYKLPIYLSMKDNIVFFETTDISGKMIYWFNFNNIKKVYNKINDYCEIEFKNNEKHKFNIIRKTIDRKIYLSLSLIKRTKEANI